MLFDCLFALQAPFVSTMSLYPNLQEGPLFICNLIAHKKGNLASEEAEKIVEELHEMFQGRVIRYDELRNDPLILARDESGKVFSGNRSRLLVLSHGMDFPDEDEFYSSDSDSERERIVRTPEDFYATSDSDDETPVGNRTDLGRLIDNAFEVFALEHSDKDIGQQMREFVVTFIDCRCHSTHLSSGSAFKHMVVFPLSFKGVRGIRALDFFIKEFSGSSQYDLKPFAFMTAEDEQLAQKIDEEK